MGKQFAIAAAVIVLLTVGALLLVNRLTEPQGPGPARVERAAAEAQAGSAPRPGPDAYQQGSEPGAPIIVPPGQPTYLPVPNESPPIPGPPPVSLPEDAEERGQALEVIRQERRDLQLMRMNRRNEERAAKAANEAGRPPPPPPDE